MKDAKISASMKIADLIETYPQTVEVLMKHGFPCIGCALARFETIEEGALAVHGKEKQFLDELVKKLNEVVEGTEESAREDNEEHSEWSIHLWRIYPTSLSVLHQYDL